MRSTHRALLGSVVGTAVALCPAAFASAGQAATYKLSAAPVASFFWYPKSPRVGETVSFVSTSSDLTTPITRYAWDFSGNGSLGEFVPGGPLAKTSFTTPAPHIVRLRVTNRDGLSTVATETVQMSSAVGLIAPFPDVRIVGSRTRTGVRLRTLEVKAPRGALIAVTCRTRACPRAVRRMRAAAAGRGSPFVRFRRYARSFPAGAKIVIRVSQAGFIGSYTSFEIKRRRAPRRVDACLAAGGSGPVACPV